MDLSNLGEDEQDAIVGVQYYVLYIFIQLLSQIAEFAILFVALRTANVFAFVDYGRAGAHRQARLSTRVVLGIMGLVSLTTFAMVTAYYGAFANADFEIVNNIVRAVIGLVVTYYAVYLAASLYVLAVAAIGVARQRSKVRECQARGDTGSHSCSS